MNSFIITHRLLCAAFVDEGLFRGALQGGRADVSTVARYLALPIAERPKLSYYFDARYYLARYPDVAEADKDPLLHFLEYGISESRSPHPLIDLHYIAARDPLLLGEPATLDALMDVLEYDLAAPGPYFDPAFYQEALGPAAPPQGLLRHYLTEGLAQGLSPNPFLDLAWYIAHNHDAPSDPLDALRHFALIGDLEARRPSARFDSALYWARYPDIAALKAPPLRHFLDIGRSEGRQLGSETRIAVSTPSVGQPQPILPAAGAEAYASLRARLAAHRQAEKDQVRVTAPVLLESASPAADLAGLRLPADPQPRLSILIPVFNEAAITIECLMAIADAGVAAPYEIVVADDASTDADLAGLAQVANLVHIRQPSNVGFIANCNAAFARCRGDYVLLLNNDTQVQPGAIDRMVQVLDDTPGVAAVGPKLIYPNGRLQEAGCFIKPNGESGMVGLFRNPDEPGFSYDRDVMYCSGAALMLRRSAVTGALFDEAFRPAYCEDADLCLRLLADGHRVRYLHDAVVVHHLSVSTNRGSISRKLRTITRNQQALVARWGDALAQADRIRTLAFYLPQFHPTPENNLWWGPGFTEWTNVTKATPSYTGHYQPHLPTDLGFYDLRSPDALAAQAGFPGVHLVYVESMEAVDQGLRPADIGFDASVEFPPHGRAVPATETAEIIKDGWNGYRYDYPETACAFITRESSAYPRYPAVFPSWDNTARQPLRGTSFDAISPDAFRVYVEEKIDEIRNFHLGDHRLLFVNAWNEWAEGTHLEPDTGYGHRWLEALRDAVAAKSWE